MCFNKTALLSLLFIIYIIITDGAVINEPNPRFGFPSRSQSVANALYSAIEWPLATFPHEQIAKEVKDLKKKIVKQSREQYLKLHPEMDIGYKIKVEKNDKKGNN